MYRTTSFSDMPIFFNMNCHVEPDEFGLVLGESLQEELLQRLQMVAGQARDFLRKHAV